MRRYLWCLLVVTMAGCTGVLQGPAGDLQAVTAPEPVKEPPPPRVASRPPDGPMAKPGTFRAWEPARETAEGDRVEGRWITISTTPPPAEKLEWDKVIPRAPHTVAPAKLPKGAQGQSHTSPRPPVKASPPVSPWPGLPSGSIPGIPLPLPEGAIPGLVPPMGDK